MLKRIMLFLVMIFAVNFSLQAQPKYTIKSKRAIRAYNKAIELYQQHKMEEALESVNSALKVEDRFVEGWLLHADLLHEMNRTAEEIDSYEHAIVINPDFFPNVHFNLANALMNQGKYALAKSSYERFIGYPKIHMRYRNRALSGLKNCCFALKAMANPVDFSPENLGDSINTDYDEYWPSLTADEGTLIFTSLLPKNPNSPINAMNAQEDFFEARQQNGHWKKAAAMSAPLNSSSNEGAQSITADGRYMYFTACGRKDGIGRCDIYYSKREGDQWSTPVNLGPPVNSASWEAQPSISADGRLLFFVSNRKGGKGKMDIWVSRLLERESQGQQRWSKPQNLAFNTRDNEMSPFVHASNRSLYFASDGLVGMGGLDLYKTQRTGSHKWGKPQNLGYPVNTHGDEMGLMITARGDYAYFSSDRLKGKGKDLYRFAVPEKDQPQAVSYIKGRIFEVDQHKSLGALVQVVQLTNGDTIALLNSDPVTGEYLVCLPSGEQYAFNVQSKGYLFHSEYLNMSESRDALDPKYLDIGLKPIRKGESVILRNVFFDTNAWILKKESTLELGRLITLMKQQKTLKIEIGGHTDSSGSQSHNLLLSQKRAKAVYDYLILHGIDASRLSYKGYGAESPRADNNTEEGMRLNRRTEFVIVKE